MVLEMMQRAAVNLTNYPFERSGLGGSGIVLLVFWSKKDASDIAKLTIERLSVPSFWNTIPTMDSHLDSLESKGESPSVYNRSNNHLPSPGTSS